MYAMVNGKRILRELVQLPLADYFIGVSTTVRFYGAVPLRLPAHLQHLERALAEPLFGFNYALTPPAIQAALAQLIVDNHCYDGLATITIVAGNRGAAGEPAPKTIITLAPLTEKTTTAPTDGIHLVTTPARRLRGDKFAGYKLVAAPLARVAEQFARLQNADEGLIVDEDGTLLAASDANIFAVVDGAIITPDAEQNNLIAGVTRAIALTVAARAGIVVYQAPLTPTVLANAAEFFVTSAKYEITPARRLDNREIHEFPVTRRLQDTFREYLREELASEK